MNTIINRKLLWLDYVAFAIIVVVFFIISCCGFFKGDDIAMAYGYWIINNGSEIGCSEFSSISDVVQHTQWWYFHLGGRFFSVASQYLFCGLLDTKLWFDFVNTLFFLLLIIICRKLIIDDNKESIYYTLLFALLFWFLCPVPKESLFWVAGSTTYLWANTLAFVYLWLFQKYKDSNFSIIGKIGLFFVSVVAAAEFITCASICGAFVVYYAFHIKELKRNTIPLVAGFFVGSLLVLFAPGNFERASLEWNVSYIDKIKDLLFHPVREILRYKVLWLFLIVLAWGWRKNKMVVEKWVKKNSILLLSLAWSVIAFSVVFRPTDRALFFTETLALILVLKFFVEYYYMLGLRCLDGIKRNSRIIIRSAIITLLFVLFMVDSVFAVTETKRQSSNNDMLLNKIVDSGGIVALDQMISSHRMAYVPFFHSWTWKPLAYQFGLDSVHVYPYYCQDKLYTQSFPLENVYVDEIYVDEFNNDVSGKFVRLFIRVENRDLQEQNNHITFTIDYTRPRKWYMSWMDKWRNYQYNRNIVVERDKPDVCFDGYCYYVLWFKEENNLKSVKYTIE